MQITWFMNMNENIWYERKIAKNKGVYLQNESYLSYSLP